MATTGSERLPSTDARGTVTGSFMFDGTMYDASHQVYSPGNEQGPSDLISALANGRNRVFVAAFRDILVRVAEAFDSQVAVDVPCLHMSIKEARLINDGARLQLEDRSMTNVPYGEGGVLCTDPGENAAIPATAESLFGYLNGFSPVYYSVLVLTPREALDSPESELPKTRLGVCLQAPSGTPTFAEMFRIMQAQVGAARTEQQIERIRKHHFR